MRLLNTTLASCLCLFPALIPLSCGDDSTSDGTPAAEVENTSVAANTYAVTSDNRLLHFDRASGDIRSAKIVSGLAAGESILGIDFRPSDAALYALASSGKLYVVDVATAVATLKSTLSADMADTSNPFSALEGETFGVNFNPVADRLRVVSSAGQNLRINVDTGATTTDGALNPGTPSVTAAAYSNAFAAACRTRLYVIDTSTSKLLLQDPPNSGTLSEIGNLSAAPADAEWAGFEVVTEDDGSSQALVLFPSEGGVAIHDLDLATAALTNMRTLELLDGEALRGSSAQPPATPPAQPPGEILGLSVDDEVVSFNRSAPGKLCTTQAVTGLGSGEELLGIDIRPADGKLYALGSAGKIYTVDVPTGAATLVSTLSAAADDMSEPFTALASGDFGVGFNPVPDRLRVIGRDGQSLRINVDTGATTTDSSMSPSSMSVAGVAYTNAFAGATTTTLFAIDAAAGDLARVGGAPATPGACPGDTGNPNCGNVSRVGSLRVSDITGVDGLDIDADPQANNAAILALRVGAATSSTLYVVDLTTGAATPPAGVANPTIGGAPLREMTLASNPTVTP